MISNYENPTENISSHKLIASITGVVVHGKGRGRTVGMPTANVNTNLYEGEANTKLNTEFRGSVNSTQDTEFGSDLAEGVYASVVHVPSKNSTTPSEDFLGVTNIGTRPTVDNERTIETHILDFDRDIYGETITIDLIEFLRGIKKFDSLEEVKQQVEKDIARTREIASEIGLPNRTGNLGGGETTQRTRNLGEIESPHCTRNLGACK